MLAGVLSGLDDQLGGDLRYWYAFAVQCTGEDNHVLVEDLGPAAVVAPGRGGALAFEGFLPDVVTVQLGGDGQDGEQRGQPGYGSNLPPPGVTPGTHTYR